MDEDNNLIRFCFCLILKMDGLRASKIVLVHDLIIYLFINISVLASLVGGLPSDI